MSSARKWRVLVLAGAGALALAWLGGEGIAAVLFHNPGTTSGWDSFSLEHRGSIGQVTSPVYKGSEAIQVTQIYDPNYTGRYHSEVVRNDGYRPGDMRFYGFAFRLPGNWQTVSQSFNLAQFIADFSNTGCDDWMPTTMMWIAGTNLHTRVKSGTVCSQSIQTFNNIASVSVAAWHRVVIQANWQSDSTGYFKVWFDGTKVLEQYNLPTTIFDPQFRRYSFRVGMYANAWHDQHRMEGTQGTRSWFIDQVGIGTTFADANPSAW
jgi:Polysaccharide lyase